MEMEATSLINIVSAMTNAYLQLTPGQWSGEAALGDGRRIATVSKDI